MRFRPFRWLVRLLVALVVLLAIGALVLQTPWAHDRARRMIESRVTRMLNGELRIGALTGSFWGGVTLANVTITQQGVPVISAASVAVRYRPWQVFRAGVVDEVVLNGLRADIVETAAGWNVAGLAAPRPPSSGPGPTISIDRLQLVGSEVDIRPMSAPRRRIADLNLLGAFTYQTRVTRIPIEQATARDSDSGIPLRELAGVLRFEAGTFAFDRFRVATAHSRVSGQFTMRTLPSGREVDVTLDAAPVSMPELSTYVPELAGISVTPTAQITMRGPLNRLRVTVAARDPAGAINANGEIGFVDGVQFKGTVELARTNLAPWVGRQALASRITGRADVDLKWRSGSGVKGLDVTFIAKSPEVAIANYRADAVDARGTVPRRRRAGRWIGDRVRRARARPCALESGGVFVARPRRGGRSAPAAAASRHPSVRDGHRGRLHGVAERPELERRCRAGTVDRRRRQNRRRHDGARVEHCRCPRVSREWRDHAAESRARPRDARRHSERGAGTAPDPFAGVTGVVNATFALDGRGTTLAELTGGLTLHVTDSTISGVDVVTLDAKATIEGQRLIGDAEADVRRISNTAFGTATKFAADGRAVVHADIPGIGTEGWIERANGSVTATFTGASAFDTAMDKIAVDATMTNGVATIRTLEVTAPDLKVTGRGTVALNESATSDLTYDITVSDLAKLPGLAPKTLTGSAHAEGRLTGPLSRLTTAGKLQGHDLAWGDHRALTLNGAFDATLIDRDFAKAAGTFDGSATFVETAGTKIDLVTAKAKYDAGTVDLDATLDQRTRTLRIAGSMIPHPEHREVHIDRSRRRLVKTPGPCRPDRRR